MTKIEQDAADALQWHRERAASDWQRYKADSRPLGASWSPTMTEQQKQEQQKYIEEHQLPF